MDTNNINSSYIEKMIEHIFLSEILKESWVKFNIKINVLRPEVDDSGYDLILECQGISQYIQLKSTINEKTIIPTVNSKLFKKKEFAVILIKVNKEEMIFKEYYYYADKNISVENLKSATKNKANTDGVKKERPNTKKIPRSKFVKLNSIPELLEKSFPDIQKNSSK